MVVVEKLVYEIDLKISDSTKEKASNFNSFIENIRNSRKSQNLTPKSVNQLSEYNSKLQNLNTKKVDTLLKPIDNLNNIFKSKNINKQTLRNEQSINEILQNKNLKEEIPKFRRQLFKEIGSPAYQQTDKETIQSMLASNFEKMEQKTSKIQAQTLKATLSNEKERTKIAKKGSDTTNSYMKKIARSLGIVTKSFLAIDISRFLSRKFGELLQKANNIENTAFMGNISNKESQALDQYFKENNVDPIQARNTMRNFALKTNQTSLSDVELWEQIIKGSKTRNATDIQQTIGAQPDLIRLAKNTNAGEFRQQLSKQRENVVFSNSDIKSLQEGGKLFERLGDIFTKTFLPVVTLFSKIVTDLESSGFFKETLAIINLITVAFDKLYDVLAYIIDKVYSVLKITTIGSANYLVDLYKESMKKSKNYIEGKPLGTGVVDIYKKRNEKIGNYIEGKPLGTGVTLEEKPKNEKLPINQNEKIKFSQNKPEFPINQNINVAFNINSLQPKEVAQEINEILPDIWEQYKYTKDSAFV